MFLWHYSSISPQDRLRALAHNESLPDRTHGSALFADISGFTQLTEALRKSLGSRRSGEELSKHLGVVYSALITEVEKYGSSVINFAGVPSLAGSTTARMKDQG